MRIARDLKRKSTQNARSANLRKLRPYKTREARIPKTFVFPRFWVPPQVHLWGGWGGRGAAPLGGGTGLAELKIWSKFGTLATSKNWKLLILHRIFNVFGPTPSAPLGGEWGGGEGRCTFGGGDRVSIRILRHVNLVYISRGLVGRWAATN